MQNEIELVIRIPEVDYKHFKELYESLPKDTIFVDTVAYYIGNGTPLPKGHGRIGDLDKIAFWLISSGLIDDMKCGEVADIFRQATIIEADTKSEEV